MPTFTTKRIQKKNAFQKSAAYKEMRNKQRKLKRREVRREKLTEDVDLALKETSQAMNLTCFRNSDNYISNGKGVTTRSSDLKISNLPKNAVASTTYGELTAGRMERILDEFDPEMGYISSHNSRECSLIDIGSGSGKYIKFQ